MSNNWKPEQASNDKMQEFCNKVKPELEKKIGPKSVYRCNKFKAAEAKIQYIAQVDVGEGDYIHLKISQELPCYGGKVTLVGYQFPKKHGDPIVPF